MMIGTDVEDYEIMIPYFTFEMVGYQVDTICHGKEYGEFITTQISTTTQDLSENGHLFRINQSFNAAIKKSSQPEPESPSETKSSSKYDGLVISGGRDPNYLQQHPEILFIVEQFLNKKKPVLIV